MTFLKGENKAEIWNKGVENTLILWREMRDRGEIRCVFVCKREGEKRSEHR